MLFVFSIVLFVFSIVVGSRSQTVGKGFLLSSLFFLFSVAFPFPPFFSL